MAVLFIYVFIYLLSNITNIMKTVKTRKNRFYNGEETSVTILKDEINIRTWRRIQLQSHTIAMSNGRIQYERKASGKLILTHICMKTVNSYYKNIKKK